MYSSKRQQHIMQLARTNGSVMVTDLITQLNVTPQTIRRDLNQLCQRQLLTRIHGGAMQTSGTENVQYTKRRQTAAAEKTNIARAAAALIKNGSSLFINIGTTAEAFSDALSQHKSLMIITNNTRVASRTADFNQFEVMVAGGTMRASDGGIVGEATVNFITGFKVDYAVIGISAIDNDGTLLDFDYREVQVDNAMIDHARHTIIIADSSKFERSAPVKLTHLSRVDTLITDLCPSDGIRNICQEHKITLIETSQYSP